MIFDRIENLVNYAGAVPQFKAIAEYLVKNDPAGLAPGRYEIADGIFMNVSEYEPYLLADKWEAHRKYADLQIVVAGDERMDCAPIADAEGGNGYNEEQDYELFDKCGECMAQVHGKPGCFAYFAPCDAHRPGIKLTAERVKKAVVKILL